MIIKNSREAVMERMKTAMEGMNEDQVPDQDTAGTSAAGNPSEEAGNNSGRMWESHGSNAPESGESHEMKAEASGRGESCRTVTEDAGRENFTAAPKSPEAAEGFAPDQPEVTAESDGTAEQPETEEEPEKKGFRKRFKTDKKQDALKERVNELEDRVIRQMAEFENFRKRTEKEKSQMFETGARSVIEKILPVVDNFERGLAAIPEGEKASSFAEGMNMIYKQLMTELENLDVKPIEAVGQEFNPNLHNAVMQVESDEYESGVIAQEMQKGYTYRDTVVRYSMVAVVN